MLHSKIMIMIITIMICNLRIFIRKKAQYESIFPF